jgi:hypothetical protein
MKKNTLFLGMLALALAFGFMVVGCATTLKVKPAITYADSAAPESGSAILAIAGQSNNGYFACVSFDGKEVSWAGVSKESFWTGASGSAYNYIYIPAGTHTLVFNYSGIAYSWDTRSRSDVKTTTTARGMEVTADFKQGIVYRANLMPVGSDSMSVYIQETSYIDGIATDDVPNEYLGTWQGFVKDASGTVVESGSKIEIKTDGIIISDIGYPDMTRLVCFVDNMMFWKGDVPFDPNTENVFLVAPRYYGTFTDAETLTMGQTGAVYKKQN